MNDSRIMPPETVTELIGILEDSVSEALRLKDTLAAEREALSRQDTDALYAALSAKSECIGRLQALDGRRAGLCEAAGAGSGPDQMEQLLAGLEAGDGVADRWTQLLEIAADCSTLNLTNGAIIQMRQQTIESNLAVLRGEDAASDTYQRKGRESAATSQRSLAQA